jgi:hypothetical protein
VFDGFHEWLQEVEAVSGKGLKWIARLGKWIDGKIEEAVQHGVPLRA